MSDGIGLAEAMLGLDGFRILEVCETPDELVITVETVADLIGCARCGVRAEAQDRIPIAIRDLDGAQVKPVGDHPPHERVAGRTTRVRRAPPR